MKLHLNIGLQVDSLDKGSVFNSYEVMMSRAEYAINKLNQFGKVLRYGFKVSNTELTLLVEHDCKGDVQRYTWLANSLQQDCIAVFNPESGHGELFGHKAKEWGAFNPEYFLSPYSIEPEFVANEVNA